MALKTDATLALGFKDKNVVGMIGFEPTTPAPPEQCATKLRYIPIYRLF